MRPPINQTPSPMRIFEVDFTFRDSWFVVSVLALLERERERDDWINYLKYYVMCIGIIREYFFSTRTHVCDSARENVKCVARAKK